MLDEGIKRETIDRAAEDFGMPMGPIELADQVGLDICLHVADVLRSSLKRPMPTTPKWLIGQSGKGRTWPENRQGHVRLERRKSGQGSQCGRLQAPIWPTASFCRCSTFA